MSRPNLYETVLLFVGLIGIAQAQNVNFESSNLPVVIINTQGKTISEQAPINAGIGLINNGLNKRNYYRNPTKNYQPDAFNDFNGSIGIICTGITSQFFPKKSYSFEIHTNSNQISKASLLGMPAESNWILMASYTDKTLLRDAMAFYLSNQSGRYAPRTKYVELVIDGDYKGVYILMEKIKPSPDRITISTLKPTANSGDSLTGGYILKVDKKEDTTYASWQSPYLANHNISVTVAVEYPQKSVLTTAQFNYIKTTFTAFENALKSPQFKDSTNGYAKHIDVSSFIDYFLLTELTYSIDAYRSEVFMHKDLNSRNPKLKMGAPWGYEHAFGNAASCRGWETNHWAYNSVSEFCPNEASQVPFWWARLLEDRNFCIKVRDRWQQLRNSQWLTNTITAFVDQTTSTLNESQTRNFQRWPILGQWVWPNYYYGDTYQEEVDWFKNWTKERLKWLDNNIPRVGVLARELDCAAMAKPTADTTQALCQGQVSIPLVATGTALKWYSTASDTVGTGIAPTPATSIADTLHFYVSQTIDGCESKRTVIEVIVKPKPAKPLVDSTLNYTQGQIASPLTANGLNLAWYTSLSDKNGIVNTPTPPTATAGVFIYYVSQKVNGCESDRAKIEVTVKSPLGTTVCLDIKVLLEGPLAGTAMTTLLNKQGLLPGQIPTNKTAIHTPAGQPYNYSPINYYGKETVSAYDADIVDWVLVSLRTAPQLATSTVYRTAALLKKDGTVRILTGCININPALKYYVVVEHRNHIGALSHEAISVVSNKLTYDFTTQQSYVPTGVPAYGQTKIGSVYCLFASDGAKSSFSEINANDATVWKTDNGKFGSYKSSDFNMDGEINALDGSIWRKNNGKFSGVSY
ncbi:CotH kinase family protein [Runella sp.]|uniref:CotH kinase family protein n=1 Tax=Runella sp. TaxID=1960881 RepID=UPI003D0D2C65